MGKRSLSLMVIDIDRFKDFNDRHGHAAGDEVLRQVAGLIRQATRETDRVYRYGGEEIVVLCDGLGHRPAMLAAERLRRRIATAPAAARRPRSPPASGSPPRRSTASISRACSRPPTGRLYEAKAAGRDRVVGRPEDDGNGNVTHFPRREQA